MTTNIKNQSGSQTKRKRDATTGSTVKAHLDWEKELHKVIVEYEHIDTIYDYDEDGVCIGEHQPIAPHEYVKELLSQQRQQAVNDTLEKVEEMIKKLSGFYQIGDYENEPSAINKRDLLHQLSQLKIKSTK